MVAMLAARGLMFRIALLFIIFQATATAPAASGCGDNKDVQLPGRQKRSAAISIDNLSEARKKRDIGLAIENLANRKKRSSSLSIENLMARKKRDIGLQIESLADRKKRDIGLAIENLANRKKRSLLIENLANRKKRDIGLAIESLADRKKRGLTIDNLADRKKRSPGLFIDSLANRKKRSASLRIDDISRQARRKRFVQELYIDNLAAAQYERIGLKYRKKREAEVLGLPSLADYNSDASQNNIETSAMSDVRS